MNMNNRIAGFDGLRAIAVLMVFFQHRVFGDVRETLNKAASCNAIHTMLLLS